VRVGAGAGLAGRRPPRAGRKGQATAHGDLRVDAPAASAGDGLSREEEGADESTSYKVFRHSYLDFNSKSILVHG
jgi:hypothetical protein